MASKITKRKIDFNEHMGAGRRSVPKNSLSVQALIVSRSTPEKGTKQPYNFLVGLLEQDQKEVDYLVKKAKDGENDSPSVPSVDNEGNSHAILKVGQCAWISSFDKASVLASLKLPCIVRLNVTAKIYDGRASYTCSSIRVLTELTSPLIIPNYLMGNRCLTVPHLESFYDDESSRCFVLPVSADNSYFMETEFGIDSSSDERLQYVLGEKDDQSKASLIGVNVLDATKPRNQFGVYYVDKERSYCLTASYASGIFDIFGVKMLEHWTQIAPILFSQMKQAFVIGYASRKNLEKMDESHVPEEQKKRDHHDNPIYHAQGFVTSMIMDLKETIKSSGYVMNETHVKTCLAEMEHDIDLNAYANHPLNNNWQTKLKQSSVGNPVTLNLSEIPKVFQNSFFEFLEKNGLERQYYGVFSKDCTEVEELDNPDSEVDQGDWLEEQGLTPVVIYALVNRP